MARSHYKQPEFSLAKIAIFAALPADALERIQNCCSWRHYEPGEPIVEYLDDYVFFIAIGEVRVTLYSSSGRIVNLRDLGNGEVFGEYPAIDGGPRSRERRGPEEMYCCFDASRRCERRVSDVERRRYFEMV